MNTLVRVEWLKMRKYNAFWWIMSLTILSYPGITYMFYMIYKDITGHSSEASRIAKMAIGNPFTFPEAWHTVAYFSSFFVFIPAIVVIMLVTNEYTFRTHRQNIIDGWSRSQYISSKLIDVLIISILITLLYFVVSLVTGITNQERMILNTWDQAYYIGLFALQTFSQLSIAFLIGFLVRKAFLAIGIFIFYFFLEAILVGLLKYYANDEGKFLPLEISDRMIPIPAFLGKIDKPSYDKALANINEHVIYTILITTLIWIICYTLNKRRDLK